LPLPSGEYIALDYDASREATPGTKCPTCDRRIPHLKKEDSPKSKVKSFRIPEDVAVDYEGLLDAAKEHSGVGGKPFSAFNVLNAGLVLVLQAPRDFLVKDEALEELSR
jgi:hypothetical protein